MKKILDILKDKEKIRELVVYGIFGVLTTIVSFGSFYILRKIFVNVNESILNAVSIVLAILFAYVTNRKFVFKSNEKNIFVEFAKFVGSRIASALFEIVSFWILNELLKMEGMLAKAIVSVFVIIINYVLSKIFVFKSKR